MNVGGPINAQRKLDLLAIGDPVLDVVVRSAALPTWDDKNLGVSVHHFAGGSEANAACVASRLGLRTALFGNLGDGHEARFLADELRRFGVGDTYLRRQSATACATAVIFVSKSGERAITYVPMRKRMDRWDELEQMLKQTHCIYTLPYDMVEFGRLADAAHVAGALVAVDIERAVASMPQARPVLSSGVDYMFFNEAGFLQLVGTAVSQSAAAEFIQTTRAQVLVVSLGPRGAIAVDRHGGCASQDAYPAMVVDTTGAGDTFNAAFLAAHLQGRDLKSALAQGCAAACHCIEAVGARLGVPTLEQIARLQISRPLAVESKNTLARQ